MGRLRSRFLRSRTRSSPRKSASRRSAGGREVMRTWIVRVSVVFAVIACSAQTRSHAHSTGGPVDILGVEQARFAAMTRADVTALDTLLADDLVYTHTTGRVETKEQFLASLRTGRIVYERISPHDRELRQPAPDVVIITGMAQIEVTLAEGRQEFDIRFTDVLVRRAGRWQTAVWQSTRLSPATPASSNTRPPPN